MTDMVNWIFVESKELDNHYKCKSSYDLWKKNCDDGLRNLHMVERDRERINNKLYTPEQLADYNK